MQKDYTDSWFHKKLNEGFYNSGVVMDNGFYAASWDVCDLKQVSATIVLSEAIQLNQVHEKKDQLINDIKIGFESLLNDVYKGFRQSEEPLDVEYIRAAEMAVSIDDSEYEEDDEDYLDGPTEVEVIIQPIEEEKWAYLARIVELDDGDLVFWGYKKDLDNCILTPFEKHISPDCELADHVEWDTDIWEDDNVY